MKFLVLAVCVSACWAVPASPGRPAVLAPVEIRASDVRTIQSKEADAEVISANFDVSPDGGFANSFETSNGIKNAAVGELKIVNKTTVLVTNGDYSYRTPEGQTVQLKWFADENGFHPEGDHIPVAPPVPVEIQRALKYIAEQQLKKVEYKKGDLEKVNGDKYKKELIPNEDENEKQVVDSIV